MKSILQSIALASAVILIASCDSSSSSGGGGTVVVPTPTDGVAGSGVKGIIDGGTLVAVDADGDQVASTLTSAGTYAIQYDAAAITAGITYPVTVTITNPNGSATTACDFQNADNSGNDCRTNDGTFVGFGTPYALPADFTLVGILSAANSTGSTTAMHVSPATNIAAALAGTPATVASVTAANLAITGLIQSITGIDLGGVDITQIATADVTGTGGSTASAAQLAVAAFAAAIVADQGAGESLNDVLTRFAASITVDASGNATGTGTAFGVIASAVARSLTTIAANTGNAQALAGATNAASNAAVYTAIGTGTVLLPPVNTDPTDVTAVSLARQFVSTLGSVIASIAGTTGSENTGGDALSVTETFATELDGVAAVSSGNATKALSKLNAALITAATGLADGATSTNAVEDGTTGDDDGIEFVLTNTAGSLTVTGVSSRWPLAEATGGNTVTITGATGTADTTGFSIPAISMVTTSGTTTLQTFTGNISVVNGASAGLFTSAAISGTVVGQTAGTSFTIDGTLADVNDTGTSTSGTYTFAVGFTSASADDLTLSFAGTIGSGVQSFTVTAGSNTILGTVTRATSSTGVFTDTNLFTDGFAALTITVVDGNVQVDQSGNIGSITVGSGETLETPATVDSAGTVTYTDGTIQSLPAVIFTIPSPASDTLQ